MFSKLLVNSIGTSADEVRHDILLALEDAFSDSRLVEEMPEQLATSYLGPDPALSMSEARVYQTNNAECEVADNFIIAMLFGCSFFLMLSVHR